MCTSLVGEGVEVRVCQCLPSTAVGGHIPRVRAYVYCACRSACPWWVFACVHTCLHTSCMCLNARMHILYVRVYFMCTRACARCMHTSILRARIHVRVCACLHVCVLCPHTCICLHVHVYVCVQA